MSSIKKDQKGIFKKLRYVLLASVFSAAMIPAHEAQATVIVQDVHSYAQLLQLLEIVSQYTDEDGTEVQENEKLDAANEKLKGIGQLEAFNAAALETIAYYNYQMAKAMGLYGNLEKTTEILDKTGGLKTDASGNKLEPDTLEEVDIKTRMEQNGLIQNALGLLELEGTADLINGILDVVGDASGAIPGPSAPSMSLAATSTKKPALSETPQTAKAGSSQKYLQDQSQLLIQAGLLDDLFDELDIDKIFDAIDLGDVIPENWGSLSAYWEKCGYNLDFNFDLGLDLEIPDCPIDFSDAEVVNEDGELDLLPTINWPEVKYYARFSINNLNYCLADGTYQVNGVSKPRCRSVKDLDQDEYSDPVDYEVELTPREAEELRIRRIREARARNQAAYVASATIQQAVEKQRENLKVLDKEITGAATLREDIQANSRINRIVADLLIQMLAIQSTSASRDASVFIMNDPFYEPPTDLEQE